MNIESVLNEVEKSNSPGCKAMLLEIALIELYSRENFSEELVERIDKLYHSTELNPVVENSYGCLDFSNGNYLELVDKNKQSLVSGVGQSVYHDIHQLVTTIKHPKQQLGKKENHGMGFHFHYFVKKGRKWQKSDTVFTFNPVDEVILPSLYADIHGNGYPVNVHSLNERKKVEIYDLTHDHILRKNVSVQDFLRPSKNAEVFYKPNLH